MNTASVENACRAIGHGADPVTPFGMMVLQEVIRGRMCVCEGARWREGRGTDGILGETA
jgi:hypothetical protein